MLNKKIVSIILILAMMFSISANSLTVFAENTENQEIAETSDEIESVSDNISDDINAESTEEENTTNTADTLSTSENEITLMSSGVSFAGGSGTEEDPYQVSTPEQLNEVRNNLDKYFIQINDIDMSEATSEGGIYWNEGKGWTPIGTNSNRFSGAYNGNEHCIKGLNIYDFTDNIAGLFGYVAAGVKLKSITISDGEYNLKAAPETGGNKFYIGGIVAYIGENNSADSEVSNCINRNKITLTGESKTQNTVYIGGIGGKFLNTHTYMCFNIGEIYIDNNGNMISVGGVVGGFQTETIEKCGNAGNIECVGYKNLYMSGICNELIQANIKQCYNSGNIIAYDDVSKNPWVAGITSDMKLANITDCINIGDIIPKNNTEFLSSHIGGICSVIDTNVNNCLNIGNTYGADALGYIIQGYIIATGKYQNHCYSIDSSPINLSRKSVINSKNLSEAELKQKESFEGFDFDTIWDISADKNNGYPFLRDMPTMSHTHIWGGWTITQEPTRTETGLAERVCEDDSSHTETAVLPVLTDTIVWTKGTYVAPTCEDSGSQKYISTVYGTVVETIPATGHSWGAWNITNKPTKTETGTAERICGNDSSHKDTVTLPILTDTAVWTIGTYVAPTCENTGSQEYISSVYGKVVEIIPSTGHAWGAWNITNKPTKTETGTAERICGNDSSHKDTVTLPKLTDDSVWTIGAYVAPTCENTGSQEYISSVYGTVIETIPSTGHSWGAWNITTKPTKTETGTAERICGNDSSHKDTVTLPKLTDDSVWTIGAYVAPTCENTGSQEYISSVYGTVIETIPATGHSWGAWNITNKPTKTETGKAERICSNDSSHKDTITLPKLTDNSVWVIGTYVAPTCEDTGSQEYISTVYGSVVETIPATGHAWGAWNITTKPTRTETGVAERICGNDSSHNDTVTLPVLTDTTVWTLGAYVAPTCENTGSQEYTSSTYGNIIEIIPATGHSWGAWNITNKPTKTETGKAERICGNDSSHKDTATLPVLTDTTVWTLGAYVAPTCEDTGSQEYISTVYGKVVETIPAKGHAWGTWNITVKPTKTETGTAERICGNDSTHKDTVALPVLTDTTVWTVGAYVAPACEDAGSQEYISSTYGNITEIIPATGHSWGAWNITNKPTKTETGTAERICNNNSLHKDTVALPKLTDDSVWTVGAYVAPTCENAGSQEYISSTYGNIIEIIPATGHAWGTWNITTKPTKTETGVAERICGNDSSHKDTVTLPILTDTTVWTVGVYVAPTCEDAGSQEYISSTYGNITEIIPATGHSWGAWNITNKPTKTETGTAERICGNDSSHKDTVILPALTDTTVWTLGAYVAPTCEDTGSQEYTSIYGKVVETISATGHAWGAWNITVKPTKTETGKAERICGNDSGHKDRVTLPKLTDDSVWTIGAYVAPTCENTGSQEYISSVYGTVIETIPATGHAWGAWNITTKPTRTETGTAERICSNDSSHKDTVTLPILTDTTVWTVGVYVAPTCEDAGSQEYISTVYGKVVETIPATGHAWGAWNITAKPTKTETGTAERICGNDSSHKDTVILPALTDTTVWTLGAYVAPTCENTGSQEYISTVYGIVIETIPATGHAWGTWNITVKPTKTETGVAERICGNDSLHKDRVTLPILTDTAVWTIGAYVAPTCEDTGSQEYTSIYGKVVETISATGHAWGAWSITTKPTKTETGVAERICGNDSSHKDTVTLPVLTDTAVWTIGAYVAPTCEDAGSQEYISSTYGNITETIPAKGHSFTILQYDNEKHWYKCERCNAISNEENHKGGQATKTGKAVCSVCNVPYGKLLPDYVLPTDLRTTYGKALSEILLPTGWNWKDSSIIPTVVNSGYEAYYTIDNDTDYDWTNENGYDASAKQIKLNLTVNVEKANQDISYAVDSVNKYTTDSPFTNVLTKNNIQGTLSFSSSDENVAVVDNNGLVTIKGAGTAVITANVSETDNYKSNVASYTLNVVRRSGHSSGSSTSYTVKFNTNGGTKIENVTVRRNNLLTEPENPTKDGYVFNGWYTDEELSKEYDFSSKVTKSFTLYAKWREKTSSGGSEISEWDNPFKDVHKNDWFYDSVKYVYVNGMMKGVASDLFAPNENITRAMFITVIYRMENEPDVNCDSLFNDVETGSYYEKAVYWGLENGIVKGVSKTEYAPDLNITREQMSAMIYRYANYKNVNLNISENRNLYSYIDYADVSDYAIPAMQYTIERGIIKGMTDNTLEPQGISTRAQAATVFMRTFNLLNVNR